MFRASIDAAPAPAEVDADAASGPDVAALNRIMAHPVYGKMFWVCVLNPSAATFARVRPLLSEAYARAGARIAKAPTADRS